MRRVVNPASLRAMRGKRATDLPSGLLVLYPFKDGSGTTVSETRRGLNAAIVGSPTWVSPRGLTGAASAAVNIYSATLNTIFNGQEFSIVVAAKVSGAGMWTDAATRRLVFLRVDASNNVIVEKSATNNQLSWSYSAGGTTKSRTKTTSPTDVMVLGLSVSKAADTMQAYYAGAAEGAALTGLGTWTGSLASTVCTLMAANTSGANPWTGTEYVVGIWNRALSATEQARAYTVVKRWLQADGLTVV